MTRHDSAFQIRDARPWFYRFGPWKGLLFILIVGTSLLSVWLWRVHKPAALPVFERPLEVASDGFVSSKACLECHPDQYASWYASYHRTMTQVASPESMLGPFTGEKIDAEGVKVTFTKEGDQFFAQLQLPQEDVEKNRL